MEEKKGLSQEGEKVDNLDMGNDKASILEKLVKYFSITMESAVDYYENAVAR